MSTPIGFAAEERSFIRGKMIEFGSLASLKNWYPVTFGDHGDELYWRDMGSQGFVESFFQNSLNAQRYEQRRVCKTAIEALSQFTDVVEPTAFIFHISRCGSTLLTQMLSQLDTSIVLSEPPVIDAFFRHYPSHTETELSVFRQLMSALGQRRTGQERHFIVKFDSWHIAKLDFIRTAFPNTPVFFLYRDPQQVLASHRRQRGPQMIPGFVDMGPIRVEQSDLQPGDLDGYCLRVLDQFYRHAITQHQKHPMALLNYQELPQIVWQSLLNILNIKVSDNELAQLKARSQFHSKYPQQHFGGDPNGTQRHACSAHTDALYQSLEQSRLHAIRHDQYPQA